MIATLKKSLCAVFAAATALCAAVPVSAADLSEYDPNRSCSLTLSLKPDDEERSPAGTEIALYRVADLSFPEGAVSYTYTEAFAECRTSLDDVTDSVAAQAVFSFARRNQIPEADHKTADDSGIVSFRSLSNGLYLVGGTASAEGFADLMPFFVTLPMAGEEEWSYTVNAEPKLASLTDNTVKVRVKKVWEGDSGQHPDKIVVELLDSLGVHDTVELNEANSWSYEWKDLPDDMKWDVREKEIPDGYSVSYSANGYAFTITNTKTTPPPGGGDKLWQTGQRNWPIPILAGGGMLMIMAGLMLRRGGRKQDEGEAEDV